MTKNTWDELGRTWDEGTWDSYVYVPGHVEIEDSSIFSCVLTNISVFFVSLTSAVTGCSISDGPISGVELGEA